MRAGEVAKPDGKQVLDLLKARMETLANPQQAAAEPESEALAPAILSPDDPGMVAIKDLVDAGAAEMLLDDARDQAERRELDPGRLALIEQAVEELFPGITTTEAEAA